MSMLQWFVDLGPSVMLPILIMIFSLCFRTKPGKAFRASIVAGIGFTGLNLVIGLLTDSLGKAAGAMIGRFDLNIQTIDIGWPATAAISYGTALGSMAIPIGIGLNMLLLTSGLTKTLNLDIWNYWHTAFTGSLVYMMTDDFALGLATIAVHTMLIFLMGDLLAKEVETFYGFPNMTFPHATSAPSYFVAKPLNWLFDRIPVINQLEADPDAIQRKLGIFGDTAVMGALMGAVIGLLSGYTLAGVMELAIQTAAVMLLIPKMVALLMEGLAPISERAGDLIKKRFPGRNLFIGMDSSLSVGHPTVLSASLLLVPITLLLAILLPGNTVLPFGDLASIPFLICLMVPVFNGNLIRLIIGGAVYISAVLYVASWITPAFTSAALSAQFDLGEHASVSSLVDGGIWTTLLFAGLGKLLSWYGIGLIGILILGVMLRLRLAERKLKYAEETLERKEA